MSTAKTQEWLDSEIDRPMLQALRRRARELIIDMAATPTGCHLGGSLSVIDILIAAYLHYGSHPDHEIVLSKGHAAAALYATLYLFGRLDASPVPHYGRKDFPFTGHPNGKVPGIRFATGSLGHGIPLALGWAVGQRLKRTSGVGVVVVGDGELQEGLCWESFQIAQAKEVDNFVVVVDINRGQNDGSVKDISPLDRLPERFLAFGFDVRSLDGHDVPALISAFRERAWQLGNARNRPRRPLALLARTKKGSGVPPIEDNAACHYAVLKPAVAQAWKRSIT